MAAGGVACATSLRRTLLDERVKQRLLFLKSRDAVFRFAAGFEEDPAGVFGFDEQVEQLLIRVLGVVEWVDVECLAEAVADEL